MEISLAWCGTNPPKELLLKAFDYAKENNLKYDLVMSGNVGTLGVTDSEEITIEEKEDDTVYYVFAQSLHIAKTYVPQLSTRKDKYKYINSKANLCGVRGKNIVVLYAPTH